MFQWAMIVQWENECINVAQSIPGSWVFQGIILSWPHSAKTAQHPVMAPHNQWASREGLLTDNGWNKHILYDLLWLLTFYSEVSWRFGLQNLVESFTSNGLAWSIVSGSMPKLHLILRLGCFEQELMCEAHTPRNPVKTRLLTQA